MKTFEKEYRLKEFSREENLKFIEKINKLYVGGD
jgi:hypothetical protein